MDDMTRKDFLGAYNIGHRDGKAGEYHPTDYDDFFDIEQEPKTDGDCISREALLKKCIYAPIAPMIKGDVVHYEDVVFAKDIINAESIKQEPKTETKIIGRDTDGNWHDFSFISEQEPKTGWIPVKTRPMTEEETEHYSEYTDMRIDDTYTILDCPLPDDGQEVLVSWGGNVVVDVFVRDSNDGCYFEGVDIDEVDAWMPLPEPYKVEPQESEDKNV